VLAVAARLGATALGAFSAVALFCAGLAVAGCAVSTEGEDASPPTVTVTVTSPPETIVKSVTVTETVARPPAGPQPTATPGSAPSTQRIRARLAKFVGEHFSIGYPAGWRIETAEVDKGTYLDTTIRDPADSRFMIRVDVSPRQGRADPLAVAEPVRRALAPQEGFREIDFSESMYGDYASIHFEFQVEEQGRLLHKEDRFFVDEDGDHIAILTQAPAGEYSRWSEVWRRVLNSAAIAIESPGQHARCQPGEVMVASECRPTPRNGTYYGVVLVCDDGYANRADRCVELPKVENGLYIGSVLICEPGYVRESGQCVVGMTPDDELGVVLCGNDEMYDRGECVSIDSTELQESPAAPIPNPILRPTACAENGTCYGEISSATGRRKTVYVRGYTRRDGTYVQSHYRSPPR
jgi:hypothetical protein